MSGLLAAGDVRGQMPSVAIARNHALVDGNKQLAWAATRVLCLLNGRDPALTVDEAERLVLDVATGRIDVPEIAAILRERIRPVAA